MAGKKSGPRIRIPEPQEPELKPAGLPDALRVATRRQDASFQWKVVCAAIGWYHDPVGRRDQLREAVAALIAEKVHHD